MFRRRKWTNENTELSIQRRSILAPLLGLVSSAILYSVGPIWSYMGLLYTMIFTILVILPVDEFD